MRNLEPTRHGLYDPSQEHDACGVGFVADLKGRKSHKIVADALQVLLNLMHRGACGCEKTTGDGAGILIQTPHAFLARKCAELGFELPDEGHYGVGMVFLPQDAAERDQIVRRFEEVVAEEGQRVLGWRDVPHDDSMIGATALAKKPAIRQIFVERAAGLAEPMDFERRLFVIRKRMEGEIRASKLRERDFFHVSSLSYKTIVYKGMLTSDQVSPFFVDLRDPGLVSGMALVHSRFSTNTFPEWPLAQPFRMLCHNGEINTLRGNINWTRTREALMASPHFGPDLQKCFPICTPGASDSAIFDNVFELLVLAGRPLPEAISMMIPEAWDKHESMDEARRAYYHYNMCLMEPWDGPASIAFTDGRVFGAVLDRNGLRPSRYLVTKDGLLIMGSETGVLDIAPESIERKGRLQPGRMFLVDTVEGRIVADEEIKSSLAGERPYGEWLAANLLPLEDLRAPYVPEPDHETVVHRQIAFGYTHEDLRLLMRPMAVEAKEALGSMGTDTPLAVLSKRPRPLYDYFKQLFAQVTNPPLDAIREELVTSVLTTLGSEGNLLDPQPGSCRHIELKSPILTNEELAKLRHVSAEGFHSVTLPMLFNPYDGGPGLERAMEELCERAAQAIRDGHNLVILSDRNMGAERTPIPALLATAGVHHHLIREGLRARAGLVIESGSPREVHHFCLLVGYGAGAVNPYLAFETLDDMISQGIIKDVDHETAVKNYVKAVIKGIVKVMSKMGISTVQSYRGAQIFEAVGLNRAFVDKYFTWTATRIEGIGIDTVAREARQRHDRAYPERKLAVLPDLEWGGEYQWRRNGEFHQLNPETIAKLQHSVRSGNYRLFKDYTQSVDDFSKNVATLRGLFEFAPREPVPIEEVEPVEAIARRFATGAMSFGSISKEAHETLAIAMNRLGGKSNTGEGGEDPARFEPDENGDLRRSAIKQVASGRFGVTSYYLTNADELQIKMAQGAKPGEGGQLPGKKVDDFIAKVRHSTPGVGLISPPPHHDIYSIEDLAQLIFDLKNSNPGARISVKLVAEVGVGTVAAGVAKAHSDVVLISGHDGGTGASPLTSIKHAGAPWELGLAETQQTLVAQKLRDRIVVQTDGQLKTGRDVVIAALLGAEEYGFASTALVAEGCIMMRVCHLNTCPVGIATQDPVLRSRFSGKPEHVVNFFTFIAEEVREYMARLGFRTMDEMIGRSDVLETRKALEHWKAHGVDLTAIFARPANVDETPVRRVIEQDHGIDKVLDHKLIQLARPALDKRKSVVARVAIRNTDRTTGTMLGHEVTKRFKDKGLPHDTIRFHFVGSAGQSFAAFTPKGMTMILEGDGNDYLAKGLSGARVIVYPPREATFSAEDNVLIGNVAAYGATSGELYVRGLAGERFCVRNSGVKAVVEGIGDHGCEYMTGGRVVILGPTGRNFAAGMSGGIAYVYDPQHEFKGRCNLEMVELESVYDEEDRDTVFGLISRHAEYTHSPVAERILKEWEREVGKFVKVMPIEYRRVLEARKRKKGALKVREGVSD